MATVALIGPDGSGKTSIARRLEARQPTPLTYLYMGVNSGSGNVTLPTTRLLHRLRGRARTHEPVSPAADEAPRERSRGTLWIAARLVHHLTEEWYRQLACWRCEMSGKLVVCDRHFVFDYAPGVASEAEGFDRRIRRWIFTRLYPAPDLVIFLDAPGHVLFARKGESTVPELERRRRAYLSIGERLESFVRVDATLPLDDVYEQVVAHILGFHSRAQAFRGTSRSRAAAGNLVMRLRARRDAIRTRFVCKALDAVLTAELQPARREPTPRQLTRPESSYDRVRRYARASAAALPGTARRIRRSLLRPATLPFRESAELVASGSGSTVFRLDALAGASSRVLKVYRRTLGQRGQALQALAREFKAKHTTILTWYEGSDVVIPSHFAVLHSPLCGFAAVACVQPYVESGGEDLFSRSDEEVLALLRVHDPLRRQFQAFAACTLRVFERERRCPDLLGHGNLAIEWKDARPRLWLIDFGIFDLRPGSATPAPTARRLTDLIERIRALDAAVAATRAVPLGV